MQHDYHNHCGYPSFCIIIIIIVMIIIVELPSTLVVCRVSFCIMFVKCNFCCANNFATRSVCVSVYLSVCMFVWLSVFLSVCMYVLLSARLPDSLLICLTGWLSFCLCVFQFLHWKFVDSVTKNVGAFCLWLVHLLLDDIVENYSCCNMSYIQMRLCTLHTKHSSKREKFVRRSRTI